MKNTLDLKKKIFISLIAPVITAVSVGCLYITPTETTAKTLVEPSFVQVEPALIFEETVANEQMASKEPKVNVPAKEVEYTVETSSAFAEPTATETVKTTDKAKTDAEVEYIPEVVDLAPEQPSFVQTDVQTDNSQSAADNAFCESENSDEGSLLIEETPEPDEFEQQQWYKNICNSDARYNGSYSLADVIDWQNGYDGDVDEAIQVSLGSVPTIVMDRLIENGLVIHVQRDSDFYSAVDRQTMAYAFKGGFLGDLVDYDLEAKTGTCKKEMFTEIFIIYNPDYVRQSMCHEIGHLVSGFGSEELDYTNAIIPIMLDWDDTDEFKNIYHSEASGSGVREYGCSSACEYFAEAFQTYCLDSDFRDRAPRTAEYFDRVIDSLYDWDDEITVPIPMIEDLLVMWDDNAEEQEAASVLNEEVVVTEEVVDAPVENEVTENIETTEPVEDTFEETFKEEVFEEAA